MLAAALKMIPSSVMQTLERTAKTCSDQIKAGSMGDSPSVDAGFLISTIMDAGKELMLKALRKRSMPHNSICSA